MVIPTTQHFCGWQDSGHGWLVFGLCRPIPSHFSPTRKQFVINSLPPDVVVASPSITPKTEARKKLSISRERGRSPDFRSWWLPKVPANKSGNRHFGVSQRPDLTTALWLRFRQGMGIQGRGKNYRSLLKRGQMTHTSHMRDLAQLPPAHQHPPTLFFSSNISGNQPHHGHS